MNIVKDCQRAVDRWNKTPGARREHGLTLSLPHRRSIAAVGPCAGYFFDLEGRLISRPIQGARSRVAPDRRGSRLREVPDAPVIERGKSGPPGIAPPAKGIKRHAQRLRVRETPASLTPQTNRHARHARKKEKKSKVILCFFYRLGVLGG